MFIADIVGQPGRRAVKELLPGLRQKHGLDLVIANGENAAGGSGITVKTAEEIFSAGVDVMTCGDHLWDQKEVIELLEKEKRFVRPANYPAGTPGQGSTLFSKNGFAPVGILNLQGRTFMAALENPFPCALAEIDHVPKNDCSSRRRFLTCAVVRPVVYHHDVGPTDSHRVHYRSDFPLLPKRRNNDPGMPC